MKSIRYFAVLLVLSLSILTGISSCAVNKDSARQASYYHNNRVYDWTFKQAGYASVHARPAIN